MSQTGGFFNLAPNYRTLVYKYHLGQYLVVLLTYIAI